MFALCGKKNLNILSISYLSYYSSNGPYFVPGSVPPKDPSCGDGARVILFYARVVQQLGFWTQKVQANVVYCYVRRRAETLRSVLDLSI